jgi:hypothetical protein
MRSSSAPPSQFLKITSGCRAEFPRRRQSLSISAAFSSTSASQRRDSTSAKTYLLRLPTRTNHPATSPTLLPKNKFFSQGWHWSCVGVQRVPPFIQARLSVRRLHYSLDSTTNREEYRHLQVAYLCLLSHTPESRFDQGRRSLDADQTICAIGMQGLKTYQSVRARMEPFHRISGQRRITNSFQTVTGHLRRHILQIVCDLHPGMELLFVLCIRC